MSTNSSSTMVKTLLYIGLLVAFSSFADTVKFCRISSDCIDGKRCCERLCLSRKACNGLCSSDLDCDKDYGELCTLGKCSCVRPPCSLEPINQNKIRECVYDSQCYKNQTCKDGACQNLDSIAKSKDMNPAIIGLVATIGLIIFVGAFYFCLRNQRSSRPSLAAKQAHHHKVMGRELNELQTTALKPNKTSVEIETLRPSEHHRKRRFDMKELHKKPPITGASLMELSVVEEVDELSEIASN